MTLSETLEKLCQILLGDEMGRRRSDANPDMGNTL